MIINVPLEYVADNPFQRRQDYGDVAGLAADIAANGLLQTPVGRLTYDHGEVIPEDAAMSACRRIQEDGFPAGLRVQLAFGHRRVRAYRHLDGDGREGLTMPVQIQALSDDQMLDYIWGENQNRSDINAIEQAELLAEKLERARAAGGSQTTVAEAWRIDRSTVANKIRLLELPAEVQAAVRGRLLSERQALALLPVVEMTAKLNGRAVDWNPGEKYEAWSKPIAPEQFIREAVKSPDKMTSDVIRDYGRKVQEHVGRKLPDYLATFDAGQGEDVVQPVCAGCPFRHNQHCLNKPCLTAKYLRFQDRIPLLAAELTGLPYSADEACFPNEDLPLKDMHDRGQRAGLVVGWRPQGWSYTSLYGSRGWNSPDETLGDWRKGLYLGRLPEYGAVAADNRPPRETWREINYKARDARKERVEQVFVDACAPLADLFENVQPLLFLLDSDLAMSGNPPERVVEEIVRGIVRRQYRMADAPREFLRAAGFSPDLADPQEEDQRLRESAAAALEDWQYRRNDDNGRTAKAAAELKRVAKLFEKAGIAAELGEDPAALGELARWLRLALADAESVTKAGGE